MNGCIDHGRRGNVYGYCNIRVKGVKGKWTLLHRRVFFELHGYWPEVVRHTCDNPRCINPDHLLPGTQQDNMTDRLVRGRWAGGMPSRLTEEQKHDICTSTDLQRVIAARHGISPSRVSQLRKQYNG